MSRQADHRHGRRSIGLSRSSCGVNAPDNARALPGRDELCFAALVEELDGGQRLGGSVAGAVASASTSRSCRVIRG